jgi:hypothetical protein
MVFSSKEGTIQIEGSEAFLNDALCKFKPNDLSDSNASALTKEGIDHAWNWFSLHATQRLLGVNFFLIAAAFLSGTYVSALYYHLPGVAAGVSALGLVFSLAFYMLESRIRELLKAGEDALKPAQRKLAELTGVDEFNISERVEKARYPLTAYVKFSVHCFFRLFLLVSGEQSTQST